MLKGTLDVAEKNSLFISRARPTALDWLSPQVSVSSPLASCLGYNFVRSFPPSLVLSFSFSLAAARFSATALLRRRLEERLLRSSSKKDGEGLC